MPFFKKFFKKESQIKKEKKDFTEQKEKEQEKPKKTDQGIKESDALPPSGKMIRSSKNTKSEKTPVLKKKTEKKPTKIKSLKKDKQEKSVPQATGKTFKSALKKDIKTAFLFLERPHITEKASLLQKDNQYVFRVFPFANKTEIKKAIKELYNVDVQKVRIIHIPAKQHRLGRYSGWQKAYKKAIVSLRKGQTIEILPR